MLAGHLKKRFVWSQLVDQHAEIEGIFLSGSSTRVKDAFSELAPVGQLLEYPISVHLKFGVDRKSRACVRGKCSWRMTLACVRCEGLVELDLEAAIDLLIVTSNNALECLTADEDGVLAEGKWVSLSDIIEDPILLALPMSPRHEGCRSGESEGWALDEAGMGKSHSQGDLVDQDEVALSHLTETQNDKKLIEASTKKPFANLKALLSGASKA